VQTRAELPGCKPALNPSLKNIDFVEMVILNILHDLHFSKKQPLEMAEG